MKIVTANGKNKIVMNRSEWEAIGKKAGWSINDADAAYARAKKVQENHPELANFIPYVRQMFGDFEPYLVDNMQSLKFMGRNPPVLLVKQLEDGVTALAHPDSFK